MRIGACITVLLVLLPGPKLFPAGKDAPPPADDAEAQFVIGNTLWTLVHEMGHALIAELDVPLLGKEEDAADSIATIALLHGGADYGIPNQINQIEFILATAEAWQLEWELQRISAETEAYSDTHSLDIQRFFNILCLLCGSDPERYCELSHQLGLPVERALACVEYEHEQVLSGVNYLIAVFGPMHADTGGAGKIDVEYEDPVNEESLYLSRIVRHSLVAELVAAQTRRLFVLPNDIAIVFTECLGEETAFWRNDRKEIIFCYDLLERFRYLYQAKVCLEGAGSNEAARRACFAR